MYALTDALLGPVHALLDKVIAWLEQVNLVAQRGLNLGYYLGYVAWLPAPWLSLVKQVALCALLVGIVIAVRAVWSLYLRLKSSVKWW